DAARLQFVDRPSDLERAREKTQHIARRVRRNTLDGFSDRRAGHVRDIEWMETARHIDHGAAVKKPRYRSRVERRGHDDEAEVAAGAPRLFRERDGEVGVDASFVKLVENDCREVRDQRILLK